MKRNLEVRKLTLSAMLTGISVVILGVGRFLGDLDLTVAAIASLIVFLSMLEMDIKHSLLIYAATSVLALLLVQGAIIYAYVGFLGYYPVLKSVYERLPFVPALFLKLITLNVTFIAIYYLVSRFVGWEDDTALWLLFVLANVAFVLFDYCLSRLVVYYRFKLQKRLGIHKYLKG